MSKRHRAFSLWFWVTAAVAATLLGAWPARGGEKPELTAPVSPTAHLRVGPVNSSMLLRPWGGPAPVAMGTDQRLTFDPTPQNETAIAGDPNDPSVIIGCMNDYSLLPSGYAGDGVVYSHDGGVSWTHHATGVVLPTGFDFRAGDPSVAFDTQGRAYYASIALSNGPSVFTSSNGIFVSRSDDGGVSWSSMVDVVSHVWSGSGTVNFEGKPYLTVDQSTTSPYTDNVYVSWTRFYRQSHPDGGIGGGDIMVGRSADGGASWSFLRLHVPLNGGTGSIGSSYVQGSEPEVAANGDLYITFWFGGRIEVWRSQNGGVSFSQMTQPFGATFATIDVPSPLPNQSFGTNAYPNIETNPVKPGHVYINVADDPDNTPGVGDDADIFFARSTDGGASWGAKTRLNDDATTNNQIFPWMSVSKRGAIHIIWYDSREDVANHNLAVFGTFSIDGGASFFPNFVVTDADFDPDTGQFGGNSFFGSYNGIGTSGDNTFHALWTDTRADSVPEQEIYYDQISCDVSELVCPGDRTLPSNIPQKVILNGFGITNVATCSLAFDYSLAYTGSDNATLVDCGDSTSVLGCTPLLGPGESFLPPNAGLDIGITVNPDTFKVTYYVSPKDNDFWVDSCYTIVRLEPALPVAFQAFFARETESSIELTWHVIDAEDVVGYNVYRSGGSGASFVRLNGALLPGTASSYSDNSARPGVEYVYRVGAVERDGEVLSLPRSASVTIIAAQLYQNWPNPFNPSTAIIFVLPQTQHASVVVYDSQGRRVKGLFDGIGAPGENRLVWDGTNDAGAPVASGAYYYSLRTAEFHQTRKMIMLK